MRKGIAIALLIIAFFILSVPVFAQTNNSIAEPTRQSSLTDEKISQIESWVKMNMKNGKIPGAAVVIVEGDKTVYSKGFGYSNIKTKEPVANDTLFEIGSNSKAFTALGLLKFEKEGLVNLNDPVSKYIPWFKMKYSGSYRGEKIDGYVDITLNQLLNHTSGIPYNSIGDIPIDESDDALEKTVRTQVDKELDFYPGEWFQYSTINYDIIGLVIQNVSHLPYEDFMEKEVFKALGLKNTYVSGDIATKNNLARGYKLRFLKPAEYNAPVYRGNYPAGYIITNAEDLAEWMKIQLGTKGSIDFDEKLIDISHIPDPAFAPRSDGMSYAYGWNVFLDGSGIISHGGNNPNYSSFILVGLKGKYGVGILTNLNSSYTEVIANGINKIISGEIPKDSITDLYISIDNISFAVFLISLPFALVTVCLLVILINQIIKKERKCIGDIKKIILSTSILLLFISGLVYCLYRLPDMLFFGLPWSFIKVWAPQSLIIAIGLLFITIALFCIYFLLTTVFVKSDDKSWFAITILSIVSGFGNALIIFIINKALDRTDGFQAGLLFFFAMGIAIYVYGQRLVRIRLLKLTNELVYNKRIFLIDKILGATYEKIEQLETGKIHAGLNNDTETLSNFANIIVTAATSVVTLICCFVYLGIINFYGLLISVFVISIAAGLYFLVGRYANKLWEETRDIQNVFFRFIDSLINGFKELKMHSRRQSEFRDDMQSSCEEYKDKRIKGDLGFANVFVIGELIFTLVIGVVAFVFPILFKNIQTGSLRSYIFVFLYMTGPVHGVLNSIPQIIRVKISYKRINELTKELESADIIKTKKDTIGAKDLENQLELELDNVEYSYKNSNGEIFKVGPVSCSFKSGEITFITGGNGSGKSTLAKLVSGLYRPDKGEITLNDERVELEELSENCSTVFSDYFLFDKLYGIDYEAKAKQMGELLKMLRIDDKLSIENGVFSTTKLSSGQRKRLALAVSYLEDRKIYIFDEWAADQDPEFKKFFYTSLLPELKNRKKCIIAITHDDRYFSTADKVIKLEEGKIIEQNRGQNTGKELTE